MDPSGREETNWTTLRASVRRVERPARLTEAVDMGRPANFLRMLPPLSPRPVAPSNTIAHKSQRQHKITLRQKASQLLDAPRSSRLAMCIATGLIVTIFLSVLNFFLSTDPDLADSVTIDWIEAVCAAIFTCELLLRLFVASSDLRHHLLSDVTYWIDLLCIVPFYTNKLLDLAGVDTKSDEMLALRLLELLRLARVLKLMRHYPDWRVLIIAINKSWRALLVPGFAMFIAVLILSGALIVVEQAQSASKRVNGTLDDDDITFRNGFEAMWCVFWIVATLGFDGDMGSESAASRLILASAIICGLLFTTMPITIIGEAFRAAWERKELVELQMKIGTILLGRGLTMHQLFTIFSEFDTSGDGQLDWGEFKAAMRKLGMKVPISALRKLFAMFDEECACHALPGFMHGACVEFISQVRAHVLLSLCVRLHGSSAVRPVRSTIMSFAGSSSQTWIQTSLRPHREMVQPVVSQKAPLPPVLRAWTSHRLARMQQKCNCDAWEWQRKRLLQ